MVGFGWAAHARAALPRVVKHADRGDARVDADSLSLRAKYRNSVQLQVSIRACNPQPQILISKVRGAAANFEVDFDCQNVSVLAQDRAYRRRTPRCAGTSRLCPLARPFCRESRVPYLTPTLGASCFSCQTSAISAGRQRLSEGHHALPGPPDGAGLLLMDPAEVPNQLESRRRAAATTSQLFSAVEDGAPKE